jgi:hypothetical protein
MTQVYLGLATIQYLITIFFNSNNIFLKFINNYINNNNNNNNNNFTLQIKSMVFLQ